MLRFVLWSLVMAIAVSSNAMSWKYDSFNSSKKTCKLVGWGGKQPTSGKLTIPSEYKHTDGITYTVTNIAPDALNNLTEVTEITIPSTIRYIGKVNSTGGLETVYYGVENFNDCPKLAAFKVDSQNKYYTATDDGMLVKKDKTVLYRVPTVITATSGKMTLPAEIECIADGAFSCNTSISNLTIPTATFRISQYAGFHKMPKLTTFKVASANQYFVVKDGALVKKSSKYIVSYPPARTTKNIEFTFDAETIGENAFANTIYAKTLVVPATVTRIADEAFAGSSLTSVQLPETLERMGKKVFFKSNIINARIPANCIIKTADHKYTFASCPSLKRITIESANAKISEGFARDCPNLETVNLTHRADEIGYAAFKNCPALTSFPFTAATDMYGDSIFANTGFETVVFDNDYAVESIPGNYIFTSCRRLTMVDMSAIRIKNVQARYSFSSQMITNCINLKEVRLPEAVSFVKSYNNPNIGPGCPITKLVIRNFTVPLLDSNYAPIRYYGPGTFSPKTYVKTTDILENNFVGDNWPLKGLYDAGNSGKVTPVFFCEAYYPAPDYVAPDATYYVPGGCLKNYAEAEENGCTVKEMYGYDCSITVEKPAYVETVNLKLSDIPGMTTLTSLKLTKTSGATSVIPATDGQISLVQPYADIESIRVSYVVNGEAMETVYKRDHIEESSVSDISDNDGASVSLSIQGRTLTLSGCDSNPAYRIYSIDGTEALNGSGTTVDLSTLASGTYIVRIADRESDAAAKFTIM